MNRTDFAKCSKIYNLKTSQHISVKCLSDLQELHFVIRIIYNSDGEVNETFNLHIILLCEVIPTKLCFFLRILYNSV